MRSRTTRRLESGSAHDATKLDIVVPYTTETLARAALKAAGSLGHELQPLIRLVRFEQVPYPLSIEQAPVSAEFLRHTTEPLAAAVGGHVQICMVRDAHLAWAQLLSCKSVVVIATHRGRWFPTREQRLANWLRSRGYQVVLEYVERS